MSRVEICKMTPETFLNRVKAQTKLSYTGLSKICGVHRRSFSDWNKGGILMPEHVFTKLVQASGIKPKFKILPEHWHIKEAARLGGLKRFAVAGNPGTIEGRKLGGRNSYKKFLADPELAKKTGFITEKNIDLPKPSEDLAELIGAILGDGGISRYQLTISLNRLDDLEYSKHIACLIKTVFGVEPALYIREQVVQIVVSRVKLIKFLLQQKLCVGSKVRQQVNVPKWIGSSPKFVKACIRGLLDTDGCFYIDRHSQNGRLYLNPALSFTNRSMPLLHFFKNWLEKFNFHPTHRSKYAIFLRREEEIMRYFKEIGSSNPKHIKKFESYLKNKSGEVPKWS